MYYHKMDVGEVRLLSGTASWSNPPTIGQFNFQLVEFIRSRLIERTPTGTVNTKYRTITSLTLTENHRYCVIITTSVFIFYTVDKRFNLFFSLNRTGTQMKLRRNSK